MIKLATRSATFEVTDPSGYHFTIDASFDPEFGWAASVSMSVHGMKTAEAAVAYLKNPAEHFVRMLAEAKGDVAEAKGDGAVRDPTEGTP